MATERRSRRERALALFMAHQSAMHLATAAGLTVALPTMMAEFHADIATVIWVQLAYSVALAGGTIPLGQLDTLLGRRTLILVGIAADLVLMLVTCVTGSIYVVIVARFLSALVRTPPWLYLQLLSIGSYPAEERGKALGLTKLAQGAALVVAVPLTGWVTDHWGWRWMFLGTAAIWAVLLVAVWRLVPADEPAPTRGRGLSRLANVDVLGGLLLMSGVIGVVAALQTFAKGQPSPPGIAAGALGVVALVAFVGQERRARAPILLWSLFGVRDIFVSAAQAFFLGFANGVVVLLLPFLFIKGYAWTAAYSGVVLLFLNLPRPPAGLLGGWLADRYGSRNVIAPAALAVLAGQLLLAGLGLAPPLAMIVAALLLLGLGDALATTANLRQIFSAMPRAHLQLAPGTNLVLSLLGATVGQAFVAAALELGGVASAAGVGEAALVSAAATLLLATSALFVVGMAVAQVLPGLVPALGRELPPVGAGRSVE
ncbi:MAG TPA: MFS transporter [Chloroflexota bacterium]